MGWPDAQTTVNTDAAITVFSFPEKNGNELLPC